MRESDLLELQLQTAISQHVLGKLKPGPLAEQLMFLMSVPFLQPLCSMHVRPEQNFKCHIQEYHPSFEFLFPQLGAQPLDQTCWPVSSETSYLCLFIARLTSSPCPAYWERPLSVRLKGGKGQTFVWLLMCRNGQCKQLGLMFQLDDLKYFSGFQKIRSL